jgi:prepilin-type N-terminal cleavage/methylation domain-containing protein
MVVAQTVQSRDPMRDQFRSSASAGFSLVEMLMVVSMIGLLSLFGFPKVVRIFDQSQVRSARLAVLNKFNSARIQARQSARRVHLIRANNVLWIEREPRVTDLAGSTRDTVGGFLNLRDWRVTSTGLDTVDIDPRGLTQGAGRWQLVFERGVARDSVIISGFGTVTR